jgi:hypothetical protein
VEPTSFNRQVRQRGPARARGSDQDEQTSRARDAPLEQTLDLIDLGATPDEKHLLSVPPA